MFFSFIRRLYIVSVGLLLAIGIFFSTLASPNEQGLALFNTFITLPIMAYAFYRVVRYIFLAR